MSDWGIGTGLAGLYGNRNMAARRQQDVQNTVLLDEQYKADRAEDEAAAAKKAEYDKRISEFADKLLAPDRERINKKSQILSQKVREGLRNHGGDYSRFMAGGGHEILAEYERGVVQSPESNTYLENKKNTEMILKMQQEGKGHLLTQRDVDAFRTYGETGEGKISYSGMLNEIEMPDAELYEYGQDIPAADIVAANRTKIYGNYMTEFPDAAEPDDYALQVYAASRYGGKGKNWQRQQQAQEEANRHQEALAKMQADYLTELAKAEARGKGGTRSPGKNEKGEDGYIDDSTGEWFKTPDQKTQDGIGGATRLLPVEYQNAMSKMANVTIDDLKKGINIPIELSQLSDTIADNEFMFEDLNRVEGTFFADPLTMFDKTGMTGKNSILAELKGKFSDQYKPIGARRLYADASAEVVKALFGPSAKVDTQKKRVQGYRPNDSTFMVDGLRVIDNEDKLRVDAYEGDYDIKGIVSVHTGTNKNGKEIIAMNRYDNNGKLDSDNDETHRAEFGATKLQPKMAVVLEDDYGRVFYEVYDPLKTQVTGKINEGLGALADITDETEAMYNANEQSKLTQKNAEESVASLEGYWEKLEGNKRVFRNIASESIALSAGGTYTGKRDILYKSFYTGIDQVHGDGSEDYLLEITNDPEMSMNKDVKEWDDRGFKFKKRDGSVGNLTQMIKDPAYSDLTVVNTLLTWAKKNNKFTSDIPVLEKWRTNVEYLNRRRTQK